jgi:hypothetical protein
MLLHAFRSLDAGSGIAEIHIQKNKAWTCFATKPDRFLTVVADAHDTVAEIVQTGGCNTASQTLVPDDQDAEAIRIGHLEFVKPEYL